MNKKLKNWLTGFWGTYIGIIVGVFLTWNVAKYTLLAAVSLVDTGYKPLFPFYLIMFLVGVLLMVVDAILMVLVVMFPFISRIERNFKHTNKNS